MFQCNKCANFRAEFDGCNDALDRLMEFVVCAKCFLFLFDICKSKYIQSVCAQIDSYGNYTVLSRQLDTLKKSSGFESAGYLLVANV